MKIKIEIEIDTKDDADEVEEIIAVIESMKGLYNKTVELSDD
jgi:hypothetical protein